MKKIIQLAFPLVISQLIGMALVMSDVWMMSQLSFDALAGGGLGATVYMFFSILAGSTVGCVGNLVAIAYGERIKNHELGERNIRYALKGGIMLSAILTVLILFIFNWVPDLLLLAGQEVSMIELAMVYLETAQWALLPAMLTLVLRGFTSAFGLVRSVMIMSIATILLNIPVSWLMAFTLDMGLAGLGYGTSIASLIVVVIYAVWVFRRPELRIFAPWKKLNEYTLKQLWPVLSMGLPIALVVILEYGLIYGGTLMAGAISVSALALHQVILRALSFTWSINFGVSQAVAILVGREFGAGNITEIKRVAWRGFVLVSAISTFFGALLVVWPESVSVLFSIDEAEALALLASVLWIVALSFIVDGWQLLGLNLLRGVKEVKVPSMLTGLGYWGFGIPAAWYGMKVAGLQGIWAGIAVGLAVTGVLLVIQLVISIHKLEKGQGRSGRTTLASSAF